MSPARLLGIHGSDGVLSLSRKVVLKLHKSSNHVVVGIDVAADFSYAVILDPTGAKHDNGFKFAHDAESLGRLAGKIKEAEKLFSTPAKVIMESTGIYHMPLSCFLADKGFEVLILNPLITHSSKNVDIRKVKTDKRDALKIAELGRDDEIKKSVPLTMEILLLRSQCRQHVHLIDDRSQAKLRLGAALRQALPGYQTVFANVTSTASLALLSEFPTISAMQQASIEQLATFLAKQGRKGYSWGLRKAELLGKLLDSVDQYGGLTGLFDISIPLLLQQIQLFSKQIKTSLAAIQTTVDSTLSELHRNNIYLLKSLPAMGFLTAVTIYVEIANFGAFKKPKQLVAFFGIDPTVKQSGKFTASNASMSKRGSRYGRRALYTLALSSVNSKRANDARVPVHPVIRDYYVTKCLSKKKKVALGAVMHKLLNMIFAVLRDQTPFTPRTPEDHCRQYLNMKGLNSAS